MGKVDCFQIPGCECWFYSKDHPPEHFHVESPGEWEVKVRFLRDPIEIVVVYELHKIPRRGLELVIALAATHRTALFSEWSSKVRP